MKILMENWRNYINNQKRHYRLVVNVTKLLTEQQLKNFPLSLEELQKIKEWANLSGEPSFLGSGTMGSAYLFDNEIVLKITADAAEAKAAKLIEGQHHPNVYEVLKVGRRYDPNEAPPQEEARRPFLIVYKLVGQPGLANFPNKKQIEVINSAESSVRRNKAWTNWPDNFKLAKESFLEAANNLDLNQIQIPKFKSEEVKLNQIVSQMATDLKSKEAIKLAFTTSVGLYGNNLSSIENIQKIVNGEKFKYIDDLASGLTFLKKRGIVFTDLKTSNVMNVNDNLIIIDIGKSAVSGRVEIAPIGVAEGGP